MDRAGGRVLVLRWVTAPAGRPRWEAVAAPSCSATLGSSGNWAEGPKSPRKQGGHRDLGPGDWRRPPIARIIQYFGADWSSDSGGADLQKRAQLGWRTRAKKRTSPVLELRGARAPSHASIPAPQF